MDIDEEAQKLKNSYHREKQRIPVDIEKYKKGINEAEKELQAAIAAGDKRLIYAYKDLLKQSKYDLASYEGYTSFLREPTKEDIQYRNRQRYEFPKKAENLSEDMMLCFHGTNINGAKHILLSGEISSGADRTGRATSFDPPGRISVTNKDTVETSVGTYMNIDGNFCYPAGCLFVVLPENKEEYEKLSSTGWMIKNVNFKDTSERLAAIITTPENLEKVKEWAEGSRIDVSKIMDFDAFVDKYSGQKVREIPFAVQKRLTEKAISNK